MFTLPIEVLPITIYDEIDLLFIQPFYNKRYTQWQEKVGTRH
jgi:hypothetical protein